MSDYNEDDFDPMDDLRDDDLWAQYEKDGTAKPKLEIARKQVQTTLGIIASQMTEIKLRIRTGELSGNAAAGARILLEQRRRSAAVFLQLVAERQVKLGEQKNRTALQAIQDHRYRTEKDDFEPTEHDVALWSVLS